MSDWDSRSVGNMKGMNGEDVPREGCMQVSLDAGFLLVYELDGRGGSRHAFGSSGSMLMLVPIYVVVLHQVSSCSRIAQLRDNFLERGRLIGRV